MSTVIYKSLRDAKAGRKTFVLPREWNGHYTQTSTSTARDRGGLAQRRGYDALVVDRLQDDNPERRARERGVMRLKMQLTMFMQSNPSRPRLLARAIAF